MAPKIYWLSGSPPCWRVLLVLEEKGIDYESKIISSKNDSRTPEILALNPRGQVPTFVDGQIVVNESGAAMQYLEDTYPDSGTKLLPSEPPLRALVLQRMWESNNLLLKLDDVIRHFFHNKDKPEELQGEVWNKMAGTLRKELSFWSKYLKGSASGYLVGDGVTLADCSVYPSLALAERFGLNFSTSFPPIAKYKALMESREATQKSWPFHWKGSSAPADFLKSM